jgi:hypothetical protein
MTASERVDRHDVHLYVVGVCVARDHSVRIAIGACCADSGGTARDRVAGRGAARCTVAADTAQLEDVVPEVFDDKLGEVLESLEGVLRLCATPRGDGLARKRSLRKRTL